jgi:two-component system copper resistance phosphate regulon response regulator CusR
VYNQSNVVDVYIKNLRRKIDDGFEIKLIHTIRGAGYRLSAENDNETN